MKRILTSIILFVVFTCFSNLFAVTITSPTGTINGYFDPSGGSETYEFNITGATQIKLTVTYEINDLCGFQDGTTTSFFGVCLDQNDNYIIGDWFEIAPPYSYTEISETRTYYLPAISSILITFTNYWCFDANYTIVYEAYSNSEQVISANSNWLFDATNSNLYIGQNIGSSSQPFLDQTNPEVVITSVGNVGIGTSDPDEKLEITGNLLLSNGESSKLSSSAHYLTFTGIDGGYCHRDYIFRPAWGTQGNTYSKIRLQTANTSGIFSDKVQIHSSGQTYFCGGDVSIGSTQGGNTLLINNTGSHNNTCQITGSHPGISSGTSTNYFKQLDVAPAVYNIPSGSVDNGYRVGLGVHGYVHYGDFSGTLQQQIGAWIRAGSYSSTPQGTINQSIALKIDNLASENVTIVQSFGIYQEASTADNYFAGNVGIGTTTPDNALDVNGTVRATEVIVETGWADFVFEDDYQLPSLQEVETHIAEKGHLKDMPSAEEVAENGISLGEIDAKLLQKIEELTLYIIEQQKEIEILKQNLK